MSTKVTGALLVLGWAGTASAQAGGDRPSEQDIFGGSASKPAAPAQAGPDGGAPATPPAPAAAPTPVPATPSGGAPAASTVPPAAAAEGTERDQSVLGNTGGATQPLSDYIAPENPLQIGGQLYLRAQTTAFPGAHRPGRAAGSAPSLLDVYLDARPNPRVRAFVLGRMSFDPTRAPQSANTTPLGVSGGQGAFVGTSATGFTTFTSGRGPSTLLDQMWIRFDILEHVFVTAGKQHVRWGTGRFWQPTDYLHPVKRNPLDVFDARAGTTMLKLHVPWEEKGWNFYGFGVTEDPNAASNSLTKVAGGARAEIIVLGAELGLDALVKRDQKPRFGVDLSTGIGDFDVYGADAGIRAGQDFTVVERVSDANQGLMCTPAAGVPGGTTVNDLRAQYGTTTLSGIKTQVVGGVNWSRKYNDNDLFTIGGEYFYNQLGYTDAALYPGLLFNSSGTPLLNFFYTGRHYAALFASFPAPYSWNYTTFTLSTLGNVSDQSFISRLDYSVTLLTHLSFEAFVGVHYGSPGGEFRLGFEGGGGGGGGGVWGGGEWGGGRGGVGVPRGEGLGGEGEGGGAVGGPMDPVFPTKEGHLASVPENFGASVIGEAARIGDEQGAGHYTVRLFVVDGPVDRATLSAGKARPRAQGSLSLDVQP